MKKDRRSRRHIQRRVTSFFEFKLPFRRCLHFKRPLQKSIMTLNTQKLVAIVTCAFILPGPLQSATDREKALVTRYVTVMVHSLKDLDDEKRAKFRQEPLILGCIAFYYYRESDPEFAEQLRGFAGTLLRQSGTTLETEFPLFEKNFTAPRGEKEAIIQLEFWGFDTEMARTIVKDARADQLKAYKVWMEAPKQK